tara:strand:- start:63 stop:290 length:228 start_codon:yes stop_codon:yes gene_type:complete
MRLRFIPINVFRERPQVSFFDAGAQGSNSTDIVIHHKKALSPLHYENFDLTKEFSHLSLNSNKSLRRAREVNPVY